MSTISWKDRNVLVTGGEGFLGSRLIETLLARGARITCIDLVSQPQRLMRILNQIEYLCGDIADRSWIKESSRPFDYIFHLAAFAFPAAAQKQPERAYRSNVLGTANILEIAKKGSVKKFVFMSAGALYTNIPKYLPIDEKHPIDPYQGVYASTKRIGELLCEDFHKVYTLPCIYFRLFNTYGPRQSEEYLVPSFIKQAQDGKDLEVLNGAIKRDFNYLDDIVEALISGAESDYLGGPINLGTGEEHSILEIAQKIASFFGVKVSDLNREVFGPKRAVCNNELAKKVLGWQPRYSLAQGIETTVKAYSQERGEGIG
jgi:nucleoside-diphosphate-sugar epimerase